MQILMFLEALFFSILIYLYSIFFISNMKVSINLFQIRILHTFEKSALKHFIYKNKKIKISSLKTFYSTLKHFL